MGVCLPKSQIPHENAWGHQAGPGCLPWGPKWGHSGDSSGVSTNTASLSSSRVQPSLRQLAVLLPRSPRSSVVATCLSPAGTTLTQAPCTYLCPPLVANTETARYHLLHPHKEARIENTSALCSGGDTN